MRAADIAEALREPRHRMPAAKVMAALPFDLAVQVSTSRSSSTIAFDIIQQMDERAVRSADRGDVRRSAGRLVSRAARRRNESAFSSCSTSRPERTLSTCSSIAPDTAGGIMTTEFVACAGDWTVRPGARLHQRSGTREGNRLRDLRARPDEQRLMHVVSLRELHRGPTEQHRCVDVGDRRRRSRSRPDTDREEVARIISKYNLLAVPVVDDDGHMLGIVTVDDVIDAIVAEQTEDVQKFGGMEALDAPYMEISFRPMIRKRAGWLCALFLGEMLTATAMQHFEGEIEKAAVLALFIPLVMSSGGNSGSQATSLIIRALALRELKLGDWWRIALRELPTGLTLGAILGVIGFVRIVLWQQFGFFNYGPHHLLVAITVGLRSWASSDSAHSPARCCRSCSGGSASIPPAPPRRLSRRWST